MRPRGPGLSVEPQILQALSPAQTESADRRVRPRRSPLCSNLRNCKSWEFKSFCDRTELKFHGEGIAAIIARTAAASSNIADAISWGCSGSSRPSSLRGSRMEDVIFSGTRDRNPTGMAEASTLIDPEIYGGPDTNAPTEIEIQDELPTPGIHGDENWDEAEIRAHAAAETDCARSRSSPGKTEELEGEAGTQASAESFRAARHKLPTPPWLWRGRRCSEDTAAQVQPAAIPRGHDLRNAPLVPQRDSEYR